MWSANRRLKVLFAVQHAEIMKINPGHLRK
jgi:hypothetical protein